MCLTLEGVVRDMKATCSKCKGIDAYGLSSNRPEHLKKELCSECMGYGKIRCFKEGQFIGLKPCPKCNGEIKSE